MNHFKSQNNFSTNKNDKPSYRKDYSKPKDKLQNGLKSKNSHQIIVHGKDVPPPIRDFYEGTFPTYIQDVLLQKFEKPSFIQSQIWPIALSGRDAVGIAQTGSGKTLAYVLPALVHIYNQAPLSRGDGPIALVLAPNCESAKCIQSVCDDFGRSLNIQNCCIFECAPKEPQLRDVKRGSHICIATPGRLIDFIEWEKISLRRITYFVLDNADRILDMGFEPQIRKITEQIKSNHQTMMFSAMYSKEVQRLAADFLHDYIEVNVVDETENDDDKHKIIPKMSDASNDLGTQNSHSISGGPDINSVSSSNYSAICKENNTWSSEVTETSFWDVQKEWIDICKNFLCSIVPDFSFSQWKNSYNPDEQTFFRMSRNVAECVLENEDELTFLVRPSETCHGDYSLSVKGHRQVHHMAIHKADNKVYFVNGQSFFSMTKLIEFMQTHNFIKCPYSSPMVESHQNKSELNEINNQDLDFKKKLGDGSFGEVYQAYWKNYNLLVAVKKLKEESANSIKEFQIEVAITYELTHPNVIRYIGICKSPLAMLTELMVCGSLLSNLEQHGILLSDQIKLKYAYQITCGMNYINSLDIVHRDLSSRNCLLGLNYNLKIADFGLARRMTDGRFKANPNSLMPIRWTSPEGLQDGIFSSQSDVWSFGVVLWEILSNGATPYSRLQADSMLEHLEQGFRLPRPEGCTEAVFLIMKECWIFQCGHRPKFELLKNVLKDLLWIDDAPKRSIEENESSKTVKNHKKKSVPGSNGQSLGFCLAL